MKLNFKAILLAAMVTFMSVSCEEGILDRSPKWDEVVAEKVELTDVLFSDGERVRPYYLFSVKLGTAGATETSGVVLDAKFVSNELALHAATYAPAAAGSERRNTYITGENGTKLIINGEAHQVVSGNIVVALADGNYSLSGVVKLDNEAVYDLGWAGGALSFGELPSLTKLTTVLAAQSNAMMGAKTVTVKLGTEGLTSEFDMNTFQNVIKGTGSYLAVDFYSEDGYLAAGTYKPCADTANPQPGEYVIGYDFVSEWFSGENWGTCWWTVGAENTVAQKLTAGDIIVEMSAEKVYTVAIDNGELYTEFTGAIPALTKPDKPQGGGDTGSSVEELPVLLYANPNPDYFQVVLSVASEGVTASTDANGQTVYAGTGKVLNLTIHSEGNVIPTGKYDAAADTNSPNTWQTTVEFFGMKFGSTLVDVVNGAATVIDLTEGTVWVGAKDGKYIINAEVNDYKFRYTGALGENVTVPADDDGGYVDPEGGDEGGEGGAVALSQFWSLTDYHSQYQNHLIGMEVASAGVTKGEFDWTTFTQKYEGTGNYLKFELYTADGTVAPGTYTASAENSPAEGEFGKGYEGQYGASGTIWYTIVDGVASYECITDGTATIEVDGDTYTITIESSVVNATYTGKLSAE